MGTLGHGAMMTQGHDTWGHGAMMARGHDMCCGDMSTWHMGYKKAGAADLLSLYISYIDVITFKKCAAFKCASL